MSDGFGERRIAGVIFVTLRAHDASEGSVFLLPGKLKLMELPFIFGRLGPPLGGPVRASAEGKPRLLDTLDFFNLFPPAAPFDSTPPFVRPLAPPETVKDPSCV